VSVCVTVMNNEHKELETEETDFKRQLELALLDRQVWAILNNLSAEEEVEFVGRGVQRAIKELQTP